MTRRVPGIYLPHTPQVLRLFLVSWVAQCWPHIPGSPSAKGPELMEKPLCLLRHLLLGQAVVCQHLPEGFEAMKKPLHPYVLPGRQWLCWPLLDGLQIQTWEKPCFFHPYFIHSSSPLLSHSAVPKFKTSSFSLTALVLSRVPLHTLPSLTWRGCCSAISVAEQLCTRNVQEVKADTHHHWLPALHLLVPCTEEEESSYVSKLQLQRPRTGRVVRTNFMCITHATGNLHVI